MLELKPASYEYFTEWTLSAVERVCGNPGLAIDLDTDIGTFGVLGTEDGVIYQFNYEEIQCKSFIELGRKGFNIWGTLL